MHKTYRGHTYSQQDGLSSIPPTIWRSMLELEFAQLSDTGPSRPHNEDYVGYSRPETEDRVRTHGWLFALADGVGGHAQGEVASRAAIESVLSGFREAPRDEPLAALLQRLVRMANTRVFDAALAAGREGTGMCTTIVTCGLRYDRAVVAHVGDSRCYLIRKGEVQVLTRDHTVASEHVRMGLLTAEEAAEADTRHILSRSLGTGLSVSVEVNDYQIFAGDMLVLCSDGLHGAVAASEIAAIVRPEANLEKAARRLVDLANLQDGGDNVSVQLVLVRDVERVGMYRGRPYKLR
jgi:serine/threonine protein phosphatase PrpC